MTATTLAVIAARNPRAYMNKMDTYWCADHTYMSELTECRFLPLLYLIVPLIVCGLAFPHVGANSAVRITVRV